MTYYLTTRTRAGNEPALHGRKTCARLLKAGGIATAELTKAEARKHKHCRYCFPSEGE